MAPPSPTPAKSPKDLFLDKPASTEDIFRVRLLLTKCLHLPAEITLLILNYAHYTPRIRTQLPFTVTCNASSGRGIPNIGNRAILISPPLPGVFRKVIAVRWWIRSRDQGSSGETLKGTYRNSWTWFEAGILRIPDEENSDKAKLETLEAGLERLEIDSADYSPTGDAGYGATWEEKAKEPRCIDVTDANVGWPSELMVQRGPEGETQKKAEWMLQRNINSSHDEQEHVIVWPATEEEIQTVKDEGGDDNEWSRETGRGLGLGFVETLRPGDRVVLFARAMFPGWSNHVEGAQVEIEYDLN